MSSDLISRFAALSEADRRAVLNSLLPDEIAALPFAWAFWARPDQLPPSGNWRNWILLGGRGSGKTRSSAEWIRSEVESGRRGRLALIGPTSDTIRRDMVEGPSGLLSISPPWCRPQHEPSTRRVTWPNGAVAHLFSAEEADRLRGPNLDGYWSDELAAWTNLEGTWTNLQLALRLVGPKGDAPRGVISTTPRPLKLLRSIMADPSTVVTRSRTMDNAANLAPETVAYLQKQYAGTTLGRQELDAELLFDNEGALWQRALIEDNRRSRAPADLRRVVVGIDPAGGSGKGSTETGIIVCGVGREDGHGFLLADLSGKFTPQKWARVAIDAYRLHRADRIVAERNFGGEMVEAVLRSVDPSIPVRMVSASRGKAIRAEPIVSLYEQRRIHHVGHYPELEDQLCSWNPNGNDPSPDRLDALVHCLTELMTKTSSYNSNISEWV